MNPMAFMQIKGMLDQFQRNHPKVPMFLGAAGKMIDEGSVIEMTVTDSQGKKICTNMKVTAEDLQLVKQLMQLGGSI